MLTRTMNSWEQKPQPQHLKPSRVSVHRQQKTQPLSQVSTKIHFTKQVLFKDQHPMANGRVGAWSQWYSPPPTSTAVG